MAEQPAYVLDTFALLAYLKNEPAAARIEKVLETAGKEKCRLFVSIINLGEILYITERRGGVSKAQDVLALIRQLPVEILPADEQAVFSAAHIKASHALSYADAFAAAAAIRESAVILTNDPEFATVESIVTVEWLEKSI
ncbi:MAG: type II toxin-antitoxin system VapC family toxin [Chloroflexi bacterium]|nr:type II toxin-antitoxin system VapC family toxin [Chloroflexota bacterium]